VPYVHKRVRGRWTVVGLKFGEYRKDRIDTKGSSSPTLIMGYVP